MRTVVATDLDGTVLFSGRAMSRLAPTLDELLPVDVDGEKTYAYMTATAAPRWQRLARAGVVVPATTRSVAQYQRLRLPGPAPVAAVVCNGARLLIGGVSDQSWDRSVRTNLRTGAGFDVVLRQAQRWHAERGFAALRTVEDLFVYLTVHHRLPWLDTFVEEAQAWSQPRGWRTSLQGRKLYLLPAVLDKAAAVAEVAGRFGAARIVAGGDSLLDEQMLRAAHAAIRPAHGELHRAGFAVAHCRTTASAGAAAGDEILGWYAEQVDGV
jgi:hypothetical protein